MGACNLCGECCRWMPLGNAEDLAEVARPYFLARGGKIDQGFLLIPSRCPNLGAKIRSQCKCKLYSSKERPVICSLANGDEDVLGMKSWVPKTCTMRKKDDKQPARNPDK